MCDLTPASAGTTQSAQTIKPQSPPPPTKWKVAKPVPPNTPPPIPISPTQDPISAAASLLVSWICSTTLKKQQPPYPQPSEEVSNALVLFCNSAPASLDIITSACPNGTTIVLASLLQILDSGNQCLATGAVKAIRVVLPTLASATTGEEEEINMIKEITKNCSISLFKAMSTKSNDIEFLSEAIAALNTSTEISGIEKSREAIITSHGLDAIYKCLRECEQATPAKLSSWFKQFIGGIVGKSQQDSTCQFCLQMMMNNSKQVLNRCCDNVFVREAVLGGYKRINLSHCKTGISLSELERVLPMLTCFEGLTLWNYAFKAIPPGVFQLTQLTFLDLSNNKLSSLTCDITKLINLQEIKLNWNNLDVIPPALCYLPNIKKLAVHFNPLRYYPSSVGSMKSTALLTFLKQLNDASDKWNTVRLMLVGEAAAGKTSLLLRLKSNKFVKDGLSTNGIEVQNVSAGDGVNFSCWDFGGQEVFLPTHQFFLRGKAVYLLVYNIAKYEKQRLEYWLQQIEASCKDSRSPPVVLVATHSDLLSSEEEVTNKLEELVNALSERHPNLIRLAINVSCASGAGIPNLRDELASIANDCHLITNVPHQWVSLHQHIKKSITPGLHFVTWEQYRQWCIVCGITCPENTRVATEFLHNNGVLLHFDSDKLRNTVILDPQWLADIMATLFTFSHGFGRKDGRFKMSELKQLWKSYSDQDLLGELLLKFEIAQWIEKDVLLVPFLLPQQSPPTIEQFWPSVDINSKLSVRAYEFAFLPLGFMGRLISNVIYNSSIKANSMWQNGLVIQRGPQTALITYDPASYRILLQVRAPKAQITQKTNQSEANGLLRILVEAVDTMVEAYYPRLWNTLKRFVVCPKCIEKSKCAAQTAEFSYEACVSLFSSNPTISLPCPVGNHEPVKISDMAPDIALADMTHIDAKDLTLIKKLGQGGMGSVSLCVWSNHVVAVKELLPISADNETEQFLLFQREAYIMSILHHPNLVKFNGVVATPPFRMVMEFLRGGDLESFLHPAPEVNIPQEQLSWGLRYNIAIDIARGMEHLQSIEPPILHRDLRPGNIFLTGDMDGPIYAKVADFGMSRLLAPEIRGALANWEWLAPEVFNSNGAYGTSSDVYSFGLILYELVTIKHPYHEYFNDLRFVTKVTNGGPGDDGKGNKISILKLKNAIANEGLRPTIHAQDYPLCSATLLQLISDCLASNPAHRPTFTKIRQTLEALLVIVPPSPSPIQS